jgi:hypothetical protein
VQRGGGGLGRQRSGAWERARRQPPMAHGGGPVDGVVVRSPARNGGGHLNRCQGMGRGLPRRVCGGLGGSARQGEARNRPAVRWVPVRSAGARREEGEPRGGLGTARGFRERASGSAASLVARAGCSDAKAACARGGAAPALAACTATCRAGTRCHAEQ